LAQAICVSDSPRAQSEMQQILKVARQILNAYQGLGSKDAQAVEALPIAPHALPIQADSNSDNSKSDNDSVTEFRFDENTVKKFDSSSDGKRLIWCFFLLSLFYIWPFQTLIQTQNFLSAEFPEKSDSAGFVMMIATTLPLPIGHSLLIVTGLSRMSYELKMTLSPVLVLALSVFLTAAFAAPNVSPDFLLTSLYVVAFLIVSSEPMVEPAVYEMAGLLPSTRTSMMVQSGGGACGAIVSVIQMSARLLFSGLGPTSKEQEEDLTRAFIVGMGLSGALFALVFWRLVRPNGYYQEHVVAAESRAAEKQAAELAGASLLRETVLALKHVWPSFVALILCFGTSLMLWPVIPGRTCVGTAPGDEVLGSWWFSLVMLAFNLSDFIGRTALTSLNWGARALTPVRRLGLAALRAVVFLPLSLSGSAPQSYDPHVARWVVLLSVVLMGLSNGWLSTVCFMRAPKAFPSTTSIVVVEQASTVLVLGLYLGLSGGCIAAYMLSEAALGQHLGVCFEG